MTHLTTYMVVRGRGPAFPAILHTDSHGLAWLVWAISEPFLRGAKVVVFNRNPTTQSNP